MPRIVRSARGELVDFDAIQIKQQLAQAPMNIEVERRKAFIDAKEGKVRGARKAPEPIVQPTADAEVLTAPVTPAAPEPEKKK